MQGAVLAVVAVMLSAVAGAAAAGCPCPKEKMMALYGTVSVYGHKPLGPRQPKRHEGEAWRVIATSVRLAYPSLTPSLDRLADPIAFENLFVRLPD
jgi:hypothetical protein